MYTKYSQVFIKKGKKNKIQVLFCRDNKSGEGSGAKQKKRQKIPYKKNQ